MWWVVFENNIITYQNFAQVIEEVWIEKGVLWIQMSLEHFIDFLGFHERSKLLQSIFACLKTISIKMMCSA